MSSKEIYVNMIVNKNDIKELLNDLAIAQENSKTENVTLNDDILLVNIKPICFRHGISQVKVSGKVE